MAKKFRSQRYSTALLELTFLLISVISYNGCEVQAAIFSAEFITSPKDKEVFVGDSVQFDWEYTDDADQVKYVQFGRSYKMVDNSLKNRAILSKSPDGIVYAKENTPLEWIRKKIIAVENRRASFRIQHTTMNDTQKYFCALQPKDAFQKGETSYVNLKVVDLLIDDKQSDDVVDSWLNQVISLACSVRVTDNTPVEFTWQHKLTNRTLSRGKHVDTTRESILKLITSNDEHFSTYRCIAKTKRTVKTHDVFVRRLYGPGPPVNLNSQLTFNKDTHESYHKITWLKPTEDGGAKITGYILEYKPERIDWSKATRVKTDRLEFTLLNLKEGTKYDIRVKARNKVTEGEYSKSITINLVDSYPPNEKTRSNQSRLQSWHWLQLSTLSMFLLYAKFKVL